MLVVLIVGWICYQSRIFVFAYCPGTLLGCKKGDYFNNPGDALASGVNLTGSLYLAPGPGSTQTLYYRRPANNSQCIPENPTVRIDNPRYCSFTDITGQKHIGVQLSFNAPDYVYPASPGPGETQTYVSTVGNCQPTSGSLVIGGEPLPWWDPTPFKA